MKLMLFWVFHRALTSQRPHQMGLCRSSKTPAMCPTITTAPCSLPPIDKLFSPSSIECLVKSLKALTCKDMKFFRAMSIQNHCHSRSKSFDIWLTDGLCPDHPTYQDPLKGAQRHPQDTTSPVQHLKSKPCWRLRNLTSCSGSYSTQFWISSARNCANFLRRRLSVTVQMTLWWLSCVLFTIWSLTLSLSPSSKLWM